MTGAQENILEFRGAYKSYDSSTVVLKGFDMTVEKGSIYSLLGPSGCGKTTILKCIIGRKRLDAGEIILGVKSRTDIGYMPQNISLTGEITIKETLNYYGWMYDLRGEKLEERKRILYSFLEIPPEDSKIMNLSGGQKRRVSLCLALFHDPQLLILDEPTVGLDPILSYSIWQYMKSLSVEQKKTIILTTHYMEEARQSNKLGMMRGGVLVVEGEASKIISQTGCSSLEEVFIQLSYKQESNKHALEYEVKVDYPKPKIKPKMPLKFEKFISLNSCIGYFLKNIYYLKYSTLGWFLMFFIPVSTCLIYEYSLGRDPINLKLGIINEELLFKHANCDNFSSISCFPASCGFLSLLQQKQIIMVPFQDLNSAYEKFEKANIHGILHIPENFTKSLNDRILNGLSSTEEQIEQSEIKAWIDRSNRIVGDFLKSNIYSTYFDYLEKLASSCQWVVHHIKLPVQYKEPIYGSFDFPYSEFSTPGIILILEFFLPVAFMVPILQDKREGIIERSLVSGFTTLDILTGYAVTALILFIFQTFTSMIILYGIYEHVFIGSFLLGMSLISLVGMSGLFFGLLLAVLCDRDMPFMLLLLGVLLSMTMTCGMFWTSQAMDPLLASVSWCLPLTYVTDAYRSISIKSWTLFHPVVLYAFLSLIIWIIIFCVATYFVIKIRKGIGQIS